MPKQSATVKPKKPAMKRALASGRFAAVTAAQKAVSARATISQAQADAAVRAYLSRTAAK